MSVFLKSDANPTAPAATMPYLEKDWAIYRGATLALLDFSNPDTIAGSGDLLYGTSLGNLVSGGAAATVSSQNTSQKFAPVVAGTIRTLGSVQNPFVSLPGGFYLSSATTRALVVLRFRAPKTGWAATSFYGILGVGTGTGASSQYHSFFQTDSSGTVSAFYLRMRATGADIDCKVVAGTTLDTIFDGSLHQIGLALEIASGIGTGKIYVDQVLAATGASAAMTAFNQPTVGASLFAGFGVNTLTALPAQDARIGRPQIHDLTARPDLTYAKVLTRDVEAGAGYVS